jgi:phage shock protein C
MYCAKCGNAIEEHFHFCSQCGTPTQNSCEPQEERRLMRIREGKRVAGVCGGVARYLELDVTLIRIVWILLTVFPPVPGILAYIVCWIVMPQDPPRASHQPATIQGPATV